MAKLIRNLPPGWWLSVHSPTEESPRCELQIISPEGLVMAYSHEADRLACDLTKQLQQAIGSNEVEDSIPELRS